MLLPPRARDQKTQRNASGFWPRLDLRVFLWVVSGYVRAGDSIRIIDGF